MSVIPPLSEEMQGCIRYCRTVRLPPASTLAQTAGPAVYFAPIDAAQTAQCHQFGGLPSVNTGFVWPETLSFLAQINLSDLPPGSGLGLPEDGLLQFYFDAEKQEDGACTGRARRGAVIWQQHSDVHKAQPPKELVNAHKMVSSKRLGIPASGLSISAHDGYALDALAYTEEDIERHGALSRDLRSMAAPTSAKTRGRLGLVTDEDWLQMGGHIQYFRDGTNYDYRLGAVLEKHGMPRDLVWGKDAVMQQIQQYKQAIPKWCDMLAMQWEVFEKRRASFEEEARQWVLLLQVPTLNRLGAVWVITMCPISFTKEISGTTFLNNLVMIHP